MTPIENELQGYIDNPSTDTLNAVLDEYNRMGLFVGKNDRQNVLTFINGFKNTLAQGYIDYYKSVLAKNPNLSTILDFKVWALSIYQTIISDDKTGDTGIMFTKQLVAEYCKKYHHENDYK